MGVQQVISTKEMLRPRDVAPLLGISQRRVYQLIRQGGLPALRRGRSIQIPRAAFERWLAKCSERALATLSEA